MHELRDVGRGRGQAFSWCQDIRKIEVLQQPNLIQKLADVVTRLRASCVIELEGGAQLTIRPATQRRRPPPPTKRLLYYPVPGWLTLAPPAPLSPDHARDSTITVAVLVLNVAASRGTR